MSRSLPSIEPLESRYAPAALLISLDPSSVQEGTGGTKVLTFKVTLTEAPTGPVTVQFNTQDGTATLADGDYVFNSGLLTFEPAPAGGEADLEKEITVVINSDTKHESPNETFQVVLHDAVGATLGNGQSSLAATATIQDDDPTPVISISNATISEGDIALGGSGTPQKMKFTVTLDRASFEPISVTLKTTDGTASSTNNADFVAKEETIIFAPGETSKTFEVDINGDLIGETNEDFTVTLSNVDTAKATISATQGTAKGTINNDDAILRVSDVRIAEGTPTANTENTVKMIFTVTLDRAGKNDLVLVDYASLAGTATLGEDYLSNVNGTLTFHPGETSKTIEIIVKKDATAENDETVQLNLSNASNAYIEDGNAIGTIANDEISASLRLISEGPLRKKENDFNEQVVFNVSLSQASNLAEGVDVEVLLGGTATSGQDYVVDGYTVNADGKITVHFNAGETSKEIRLTVVKDTAASDDETAQLSISGTKNAVTNTASSGGSFTILNDDGRAYLKVRPNTVAEGTDKVMVTVDLVGQVEGDVTFNFTTANGTALAGSDFTTTTTTGKIVHGSTSTQIEVPILNDSISEGNEKFTAQISGGTGGATTASLNAVPSAEITITDGDTLPEIGFDSTEVVKIVEGHNGTKTVTLKLKLDAASGQEVSVRAKGVNGTAVAGEDFVFDQIVKIPAGQTETTFTVTINGDTADEIDENFFVQLSEATGVTIDGDKDEVEIKILNDDRQLFVQDFTVSEGAGQATFKIRLNAPSLHPVTVSFKTSNGTAIGTTPAATNDDYVPVNLTGITFAPGETEKEVTVNLTNDFTAEDAETFFGELFDPTNAAISVPKATATIANDDAAFRIVDTQIVEGGPGAKSFMVFTVKREGPATGILKVDYATQNGTAVAGSDYTGKNGTLTFADGDTEETITVEILGDSAAEGASENFSVKLSNARSETTPGATVALLDDTGVGTIIDDEAAVVTISDQQIIEGDNGTLKMVFVVTVTGAANGVRLNYATVAGTATTADFTTTTGTLTFNSAGSQSIEVPIIGDVLYEGDQEFTVKLTQGSGSATVNFVDDTGVGKIIDNETQGGKLPIISVIGGKVVEGDSGQREVRYTVKLDHASDQPVTVDFTTADGTATAGIDYVGLGAPKKITFLPGQTEVEVSVVVNGDTDVEFEETILGVLSNPTNGTTVGGTNTPARILNDELLVTIDNDDLVENEGIGHLTINLVGGTSSQPVTVTFVVNNGTATRGSDFTVVDSEGNPLPAGSFDPETGIGTVVIPANQDSAKIYFKINEEAAGEEKFEGNEKFTVKLTDAVNAAVGEAATGEFTIVENQVITVAVSDQYLFEGETTSAVIGTPTVPGKLTGPLSDPAPEPAYKTAQIVVTLSGKSEVPITVKASSILGGTAGDSDFKAFEDKEITFAPGETSKTISVDIVDDQVDELAKTFKVHLTDATHGTIGADGTVTILDNDLRGISIGDATISEGASGTKEMTFTISLSAAATKLVKLKASTLNSSATAGTDFVGFTDQEIIFNPGETTKTITVTINGDNVAEADELFAVSLTNAEGAVITDSQAQGRILSDEIVYRLTPGATTINESDGNKIITYTVTRALANGVTGTPEQLAALLNSPGSVSFTTVDGTAKGGASTSAGDFVTKSGTVQFAAGATTGTFTVTVNDDTAYENNENFIVRLTESTGGVFVIGEGAGETQQATLESAVTIISNETVKPTLTIANVSKAEGLSGTSTMVFTLQLSAANETEDVTFTFSTEDVSANSVLGQAFQDYVAQDGSITFAKGETSKTISITVNGDSRDEPDSETFKLKVAGNSQNVEAIGTIVDDDATPKLIFDGANNGDLTVIEGNDGTTTVTLKLKLSNASETPIKVRVSLVDGGTATRNVDYVWNDQFVTFAADQTTAEVTFTVNSDQVDELNESFQVKVEKATDSLGEVVIQDSTALVTITDDDAAPQITIGDAFEVVEGNNGSTFLKFTVTINGTSDRPITVDFSSLNGTATSEGATADYKSVTGKLTWQPGDTMSQEIMVEVLGDVYKEADETLQVKLSNASNATIARDTGTGKILQDNDTKVILTIKDSKIVEGNSGTKQLVFTVELSGASDVDTTFTAVTVNGTAVAGTDYAELNQAFTIPAGSTSVSVSVTIGGDNTFEATESFFVNVLNVSSNVEVFDGEARGTIYNDDIQFVNSRTIRYVDVDGDLVTLRITKGILFDLTSQIYDFDDLGSVGGKYLKSIDFRGNPSLFNGTSVFVSAEPQPGFAESGGVSDGKADVGFIFGADVDGTIFSRGIDFVDIIIDGDLGGIQAGDIVVTPSIRGKLVADSLGAKDKSSNPLPDGAPGNAFYFLSRVNAINVAGDVNGLIQTFGGSFGDIGSLTIGGSLQGLSDEKLGRVIFSGSIGKATVGKIIGGSTAGSGSIIGSTAMKTSIGSVNVLDGVVGGSGDSSGVIIARNINSVTIGSQPSSSQSGLIGGAGDQSGAVIAPSIGKVVIGSSGGEARLQGGSGEQSGLVQANTLGSVTIFGNMIGGSASDSGQISVGRLGSARIEGSLTGGSEIGAGSILSGTSINSLVIAGGLTGGSGEKSGYVRTGDSVNSVTIGSSALGDGDLVGGSGKSSGFFEIGGALSNVTIHGDLRGGAGSSSGGFKVALGIGSLTIGGDLEGGGTAAAATVQSGFISADRIARMTIKGDWIGGTSTGIADSGSIRVAGDVGSLQVLGDVLGTASSRLVLAAEGKGANHVAIGNLTIAGKAEYLDILGGYGGGATASSPRGNLTNADVVIKSVAIDGDVRGINIVAGVAAGTDGKFGTSDDAAGLGASINNPSLLSKIAKVTIKGAVETDELDDAYGIVAQHVEKLVVGGAAVTLIKGPSNDKGDASKKISDLETFKLLEI